MRITEDYQALGGPPCLDFIATLRSRTGAATELLDCPDALAVWISLSPYGAHVAGLGISEDDLARAITLREAAYRVIQAARQQTAPDAGDLEVLNRAARLPDLTPQARIPDSGAALSLSWRDDAGVSAVLSSIARDTIALVTGSDVGRVKPCANHKCERLFFDGSQAKRRRWCSMERCGNQAKLSQYRSRHRSKTTGD
ncbi:MAG: ABATE domain-containing protein [Marinibacterium sp.]|nr:ABATE domain-containing protein [Marinibacterium sp.]